MPISFYQSNSTDLHRVIVIFNRTLTTDLPMDIWDGRNEKKRKRIIRERYK